MTSLMMPQIRCFAPSIKPPIEPVVSSTKTISSVSRLSTAGLDFTGRLWANKLGDETMSANAIKRNVPTIFFIQELLSGRFAFPGMAVVYRTPGQKFLAEKVRRELRRE